MKPPLSVDDLTPADRDLMADPFNSVGAFPYTPYGKPFVVASREPWRDVRGFSIFMYLPADENSRGDRTMLYRNCEWQQIDPAQQTEPTFSITGLDMHALGSDHPLVVALNTLADQDQQHVADLTQYLNRFIQGAS